MRVVLIFGSLCVQTKIKKLKKIFVPFSWTGLTYLQVLRHSWAVILTKLYFKTEFIELFR